MFAQICSALMSRYGTDALENPRPNGARLARAESEAADALRLQPDTMLLSERLKNPGAYCRIQTQRREMLLSLLMVSPNGVAQWDDAISIGGPGTDNAFY